MSSRPFIRHVVFFSARNTSDIPMIVDGLNRLGKIPHSQNFEVSQNRRKDALSDDVDVIVYAEFDSEAALDAYKAHPIYQEAITIVRPLREIRIAADF